MLGLRCSAGFSLVVVSEGYSRDAVNGRLLAVASLAVGYSLSGISSCGSSAPEHRLSTRGTQA